MTKFVPIQFTPEMVRRIVAHQKWETRRVVKPQPAGPDAIPRPRLQPGDIAYIREPIFIDTNGSVIRRANFHEPNVPNHAWAGARRMHAELARVWLPISESTVEPLQLMSEYSLMREGFAYNHVGGYLGAKESWQIFKKYWNHLHEDDGALFDTNPYVFKSAWGDILREPPAGWDKYLEGVFERRAKREAAKKKKAGI